MSKVLAFDTETRGLDWFDPDHQAFLATWADENGEYAADLSDYAERFKFVEALAAADEVVCHNLSFDTHMVRESLGFDVLATKVVHDTDLMSRILHPEGKAWGSHSLKNLAKVHLRADADESENAIKEMGKAIGLTTIKQTGAYFDIWRAYPDVMEEYARWLSAAGTHIPRKPDGSLDCVLEVGVRGGLTGEGLAGPPVRSIQQGEKVNL